MEIIPWQGSNRRRFRFRVILVSPDEKMHSYAISLNFSASNHVMDCEALLAGLVASDSKGMEDLYVFIDSLTLVAQIEGNHTPATKPERKYKEEIMNATTPFHKFWITHLLKILNSKTKVLTGWSTIKLEFLNQEVLMGIKTRPSVEGERTAPKGKPFGLGGWHDSGSAGWTTTHLHLVCPKLGATSVLQHTTRPSLKRKMDL
ncbi:reverse transcriptase domain-containing protein [Tanacetum coccineum]